MTDPTDSAVQELAEVLADPNTVTQQRVAELYPHYLARAVLASPAFHAAVQAEVERRVDGMFPPLMPSCGCARCLAKHDEGKPIWERHTFTRMILCPKCGNKRCPKATWHENECTGSNEPGQPGSRYGGLDLDGAGR